MADLDGFTITHRADEPVGWSLEPDGTLPYGPATTVNVPAPPPPPLTTGDVQAVVEGATVSEDDGRVEFMGERFRLAENIGLMPLLKFSFNAKKGADSEDMEALVTMYVLIRDAVDQTRPPKLGPDGAQTVGADGEPEWDGPSEWDRFEEHAINVKADGEDLMGFIGSAMSVISARPRKRRGDSSASSPRTSASTKASSSSQVTPREIEGLVPVKDLGRST